MQSYQDKRRSPYDFGSIGRFITLVLLLAMVLWLRSFIQAVVAVDQAARVDGLSKRIEHEILGLGYDHPVARSCGQWAGQWRTWRHRSILTYWAQQLSDLQKQQASITSLSQAQQAIALKLRNQIHGRIEAQGDHYDLGEVIQKHQGQCLGFTQLYYVLASALGLDCIPINVLRTADNEPMSPGEGHVSCMVRLADRRTILFDLVDDKAHPQPFDFEQVYQHVGVMWQRMAPQRHPSYFSRLQCLDRAGLQAQLINARGADWGRAGQWQRALECFQRAIELDPNALAILNNRAGAYLKCGQLDLAWADCQQSLQMDPERPDSFNTRGLVYTGWGRLDEALSDFDRAVELCPEFAKAYNNRGCVYKKTKQYDLAIDDFNRALALDRHYLEAYHNRANAFTYLGDYHRAIKSYNAAARCQPRQQEIFLSRGLVYAMVGQERQACRDLKHALQLSPAVRPKVERIVNRFGLDLPLAQVSTRSDLRAIGQDGP